MPLYPGDVSEYVDSRADPVRLTVEITAPDTPGGSYHSRGILDGGRTVEGTFTPPPGDWEQTDPMTQAVTKTRRTRGATESAVETGRRLFDAVFSGPLSRCWAEAVERASGPHGLQVMLRSADLGVQGLAWELLYDPVLAGGHIMLADGWSILREVPGQPAPPPPHAATKNLAVLVVTSDYPLDVDTEQDIRLVADLLSDASIDVRRGVASSTVGRVLANAHADVIHFAGTGMRLPVGRQQLAFGTPDKVRGVSGGSIVEVLRTGPQRPTFLVLAACETDTLAAELAAEVPVVVGMRGAISNPGCVAFLQGFYGALRRGSPADQAVAAGRSQQFSFSRGVATEWATPVAFTAPGARLVRPPDSGPVPRITTGGDDMAGADENRRQRLVLDMKRRNADALRDQWGPVEPALWPDFVRRQLADLESGIAEAQTDAGGTR